jgi:hypothetical protein
MINELALFASDHEVIEYRRVTESEEVSSLSATAPTQERGVRAYLPSIPAAP